MSDILKAGNLEELILEIRGKRVLLDSDIAEIYGVETKRINEAVRNNPEKFPEGYIVELNKVEWEALKSKFSTSRKGGKVKLPSAFTEKGLYMLATILKSPVATQATITIIETFSRLRELSSNIRQLSDTSDQGEQKSLMRRSGELMAEIFDELNFAVLKFKHTIKKQRGKQVPSPKGCLEPGGMPGRKA